MKVIVTKNFVAINIFSCSVCTNEKQPHSWCENTASHHGVDLAWSFSKGS
jgi:hypothetical protein